MKEWKKSKNLFPLLISIILIVFITTIGVSGLLTTKKEITTTAQTTDFTQYVNVVQGPGAPTNNDRQVFMRYPLGRIGLWSRSTGEIPDSITRGVKIYPVIDQMVAKDITDWRGTIVGSPSKTDITYLPASPAKGSTVSMTVTPNLSIYKYHFTGASSFGAVGITLGETNYTGTWPTRNVTVVDNQTIQATIGNSNHTIYYLIKFSVPGSGSGSGGQGYMKFGSGVNDVTVAVALSHTSFATAQQFFSKEFSDFNFDAAVQRLKDAWNEKLGKIDIQNGDQLTKQILYTALYTVYANIIDSSDGSVYSAAAATYGSRFLTIGSSPGWAYIGGGYLRCIWDQGRDVYHLLSLIDPPVLKELLHGYMATYDVNKVMLGNLDAYCKGCWNDQQFGMYSAVFLRAYLQGIQGVDYNKAEKYIADTYLNPNNTMTKLQYLSKGYIPQDVYSGSNYMTRTLEWGGQLQGLALLAHLVGDDAIYNQTIGNGKNYVKSFNTATMLFQGKTSSGAWATANAGFMEGSDKTYQFDIIHDPLGLTDLHGDAAMTSKLDALLTSTRDYNDYMLDYPYLPIYSNSPSTAQNIIRTRFYQQFKTLNIWEGWYSGSHDFYTSTGGAAVLAVLGLFPIEAPGAQWIINSPSFTTAVIHGAKNITIQADNNSPSNIYVSSLKVNGQSFPSHFISGKTLTANDTTITFGMAGTPSHIGNMYITGTDGEVLSASTDNTNYLRFQNDPLIATSRAKIYATKKPVSVTVNGTALSTWTYDATNAFVDIKGIPAGDVLISFGGPIPSFTPLPSSSPSSLPSPSSILSPSSIPSPSPTPITLPSATPIPSPSEIPTVITSPTIQPTEIPTDTLVPTISSGGLTTGNLSLHFESIDPKNNPAPKHSQRKISLYLYKDNNFSAQPITQINDYVSYVPTDTRGVFINQSFNLPVVPGSYYILAKSPNGSLRAALNNSQLITLTANQNNQLGNSLQTLSMGDLDNNNSINSADYNILVDCFGDKATSSTCTDHNISDETKGLFPDINDDGIVDLIDYNILIRHFGESGL